MIDIHTHPVLIKEMVEEEKLDLVTRKGFNLQNTFQPLETFFLQMDVAGIEKAVLLPIDATSTLGYPIFTNQGIAKLTQRSSRFIGFASVDPHDSQSRAKLKEAILDLGLKGIKLDPGLQAFYPNDQELGYPLYEEAQTQGLPILFHCGLSWEPASRMKYSHPLFLEDVVQDFPELKIIIAHLGWPWVLEAVALALKHPNIFLDTSALYADTPKKFLRFLLTQQIPITIIENSLREQILFGSNYPCIEIKKMAEAIKDLPLSEDTLRLIFSENARRVLKLEEKR